MDRAYCNSCCWYFMYSSISVSNMRQGGGRGLTFRAGEKSHRKTNSNLRETFVKVFLAKIPKISFLKHFF